MFRVQHSICLALIDQGKARNRKCESWRIVNHRDGKFYSVFLYSTRIAIGRIGERPFIFCCKGWGTVTTMEWLNSLGCPISRRKVVIARERNEYTHRMNNVYASVLHINGVPMWSVNETGEKCLRYEDWYYADGRRVPEAVSTMMESQIYYDS